MYQKVIFVDVLVSFVMAKGRRGMRRANEKRILETDSNNIKNNKFSRINKSPSTPM